jgi:hypothetical protein
MAYTGSEANRDAADRFVDQIALDPDAMAAAMNAIVETPLGAPVTPDYSELPVEKREARMVALGAATNFLTIGPDSGNFEFDRPTETAFSKDKKLDELLRLHRVNDRNPQRQQEVTQRIRARRLGIYASRWATANATIAQTYRQVVY